MAHILASLMFGLIAIAASSLIALMLVGARSSIVGALRMSTIDPARRHRTPVRIKARRAAPWPEQRSAWARRAA